MVMRQESVWRGLGEPHVREERAAFLKIRTQFQAQTPSNALPLAKIHSCDAVWNALREFYCAIKLHSCRSRLLLPPLSDLVRYGGVKHPLS